LNAIAGIRVDLEKVVTNIVLMRVAVPEIDLAALQSELRARGVAIGRFKEGGLSRLVTHSGISEESVQRFLQILGDLMQLAEVRAPRL
jgi:threonine aldolase